MGRIAVGLCLAGLILMAACAGRDFTRPQPDTLVLGKTTYEEIVRQFGDPFRKGTALKEGQTVTSISYAFASATAGSGFGGVTPARAMGYYFVSGVLVGYEFTSSYPEDRTDFDETKVPRITKGQTTRAQVEELLGHPGGMYTYPLITTRGDTALVYLYTHTRAAPFSVNLYQKKLVVSLDPEGRVSDVAFSTSGER